MMRAAKLGRVCSTLRRRLFVIGLSRESPAASIAKALNRSDGRIGLGSTAATPNSSRLLSARYPSSPTSRTTSAPLCGQPADGFSKFDNRCTEALHVQYEDIESTARRH